MRSIEFGKRLGVWAAKAVFVALLVQATACVGGAKKLTQEEKDKLGVYVLDALPPSVTHVLNVNFENKVTLLGYTLQPETAAPGQEVTLTFYWRLDSKVGDGWMLFTHLSEPVSQKSDNLDWGGPLRESRGQGQILGPDHWEKGKVYSDVQTYRIPDWVEGPEMSIMTGVWKGDSRLKIVAGPNDGDNRAIVGVIKTGVTAGHPVKPVDPNPVPKLSVPKLAAGQTIVIDGRGDDAAWINAAATGAFVDVGNGHPNTTIPVQGSAKITWDDNNLYVLFSVDSDKVVGGFTSPETDPKGLWTTEKQPKLWVRDTVEMMIDPDGDGDNNDYYELQINPQNKVFHSQFDTYNSPVTAPDGPFGHEDWNPKLTSAVILKGGFGGNTNTPPTTGYFVEASIPWSSFTKAARHPPKDGDTWRMNFYAMKNNGGVAWSPILGQGNFHKAPRFGKIVWVVPGR